MAAQLCAGSNPRGSHLLKSRGNQAIPIQIKNSKSRTTSNVLIPDFSGEQTHFPAKRKIFLQIHRNTPENSQVHPIRRFARRTETYPILPFLFLITTRRFGGVGALEGSEKVPDHIFLEIEKKVAFLAEDYGINRIFLQNCVSGGRLWMDFYLIFVKSQ
jgi:hypothetical protein